MRVRVFVKKQRRVDRLTYEQQDMLRLGTVGVASVIQRVQSGRNAEDQPAKPLTKSYAIRKTKRGRGNRRNLTYTGSMLRELTVRTVSENQAKAALSTRENRDIKARANERIEQWLAFSRTNIQAVKRAAQILLQTTVKRRMLKDFLG